MFKETESERYRENVEMFLIKEIELIKKKSISGLHELKKHNSQKVFLTIYLNIYKFYC